MKKYIEQFYAVEPERLVGRVILSFVVLCAGQLIYLLGATKYQFLDVVLLLTTLSIGLLFLSLIKTRLEDTHWPKFRQIRFFNFFVFSFVITLVFSRLPYVLHFLQEGMYATRTNPELSSGGWYTYMSVFFYPLAILIPFIKLSGRRLLLCLLMLISILSIDLLVIGTRNIPTFVVFFILMSMRVKKSNLAVLTALLCICLVLLMDYQTKARSTHHSADDQMHEYSWVNTLSHSRLFENLPLTDQYMSLVEENPSLLGPATYLLQYLTHSYSELSFLLDSRVFSASGGMFYIKDEICLVTGCDREEIGKNLSELNPRIGLYQTIYSSLLIDFGYLGLTLIFTLFLLIAHIPKSEKIHLPIFLYLIFVICFSGIDNYLYNGLGLARFLLFIILWHWLSKEIVLKKLG